MAELKLLNQAGAELETINLNDAVFGIEPNNQAVVDVINAQRAAMRQGTQSAKTRAEVRGGGKKPWRQKGTGRARVGSSRNPVWTGGGVAFAPKPRSYNKKVNRKVRRLALKSVLSSKLAAGNLIVLDQLTLEAVKTKSMVEVMNAIGVSGKVMFLSKEKDLNVALSARNIPGAYVSTTDHASVYELMNYRTLVLTSDAVAAYEEVLG